MWSKPMTTLLIITLETFNTFSIHAKFLGRIMNLIVKHKQVYSHPILTILSVRHRFHLLFLHMLWRDLLSELCTFL